MKIKAITYNYISTDGTLNSVIVGMFSEDQIQKGIDEIVELFGRERNIKKSVHDENNNYYLEFDDDENTYFYTGDYILNEIKF